MNSYSSLEHPKILNHWWVRLVGSASGPEPSPLELFSVGLLHHSLSTFHCSIELIVSPSLHFKQTQTHVLIGCEQTHCCVCSSCMICIVIISGEAKEYLSLRLSMLKENASSAGEKTIIATSAPHKVEISLVFLKIPSCRFENVTGRLLR